MSLIKTGLILQKYLFYVKKYGGQETRGFEFIYNSNLN